MLMAQLNVCLTPCVSVHSQSLSSRLPLEKKQEKKMKRRMTLSLVLTLSVLLSLVSLPSTAQGAPPQRFRFATGVVTPGAGQRLRVTVVGEGASDTIGVRFVWTQYMAAGCSGMPPVCRHTVDSQGATPLVTLNGADEALSFDVQGTGNGVRVVTEINSRDVHVNAFIIDSGTEQITCQFQLQEANN
jgi:hypothetical protein